MGKTIEIKTSQNVAINFELADARDRVFAFFIDILIKVIILMILEGIFAYLMNDIQNVEIICGVLFHVLYTLLFEAFMNGQTPGKKLLGIQVIHVEGKQLVFLDYVIRWSFRIIDVYLTFGVLAVMFISSSTKNQRIGDQLSNTVVVFKRKKAQLKLQDILKIESKATYEVSYPLIVHFKEKDILLIKETIDRYIEYKNPAHLSALRQLSQMMQERLECTNAIDNDVQFLRTVIKDYVVLTR